MLTSDLFRLNIRLDLRLPRDSLGNNIVRSDVDYLLECATYSMDVTRVNEGIASAERLICYLVLRTSADLRLVLNDRIPFTDFRVGASSENRTRATLIATRLSVNDFLLD